MIVLFIIGLKPAVAQDTYTFQTWLDYDHHHRLSGKWVFSSDYGLRWSDLDGSGYWRLHARPAIEYRLNTLHSFYAGVGLFNQHNVSADNTFEVRPFQGYRLSWPNIGRFRIYHLLRLEERIVTSTNSTSTSFTLKGRYKIATNIPINNSTISVGTFYVPVKFELFTDLILQNQELISDRSRFEAGLGYRYSRDLKFRVLYTLQLVRNNTRDGIKQGDHVIRFTVSQNFGFD